MKNLVDYLSKLNTVDNTWGLYVNPHDINSYRIGQICFENGGLLDNYVFVDTLDNLSFGFQSVVEILKSYLNNNNEVGEFIYSRVPRDLASKKGKKSKCNVEAIIEAYFKERLDKQFHQFLEEEINIIWNMWSVWEAEAFIEGELLEILEERTNG